MTTNGDGIPRAQPAGFWRRMFAGLFDMLFLLTAAMVLILDIMVALIVLDYCGWLGIDASATPPLLWITLALVWWATSVIVLPVLYYTLAEGAYGQSLGKALFGITVITADGHAVGYGRAFARLLTLPYALIPAGLGLFWAALPPAKRAWHDYISATRVVETPDPTSLQATADQQETIATTGQSPL
jgi:uncharacterized RDD family membrane protein YckC